MFETCASFVGGDVSASRLKRLNCASKPCGRATQASVLPRITFVEGAKSVDPAAAAWLERQCLSAAQDSTSYAVRCCHALSSHQTQGDGHAQRTKQLGTALRHSDAVVAAYCRADALPSSVQLQPVYTPLGHAPRGRSSEASTSEADADSSSEWMARRAARRQRVLVGVARASSDRVMVGVLDHVMVLPQLRRGGLGRRLIAKACQQLARMDVIDVGSLVCDAAAPALERSGFGPDRLGSTGMLLSDMGRAVILDVAQEAGTLAEGAPRSKSCCSEDAEVADTAAHLRADDESGIMPLGVARNDRKMLDEARMQAACNEEGLWGLLESRLESWASPEQCATALV